MRVGTFLRFDPQELNETFTVTLPCCELLHERQAFSLSLDFQRNSQVGSRMEAYVTNASSTISPSFNVARSARP
jgi:hypothetical protein